MHHQIFVAVSVLLLSSGLCKAQRVQGRYLPPPSQDRPCTSSRCGSNGKPDDPYLPDDYKTSDKSDSWPGDSRPGSDYQPKPDRGSSPYGGGGTRVDKPPARDDYIPKPPVRDDYNPKPVRDDYNPKPARDDYVPKPPTRDDYDSKPPVRDVYPPKPDIRDDYRPKPEIRDDYRPKPDTRDDYIPKPPVRDDYGGKPDLRDEYVPKPVVRDDYGPKPGRDDYRPKPVDKIDEPKPGSRDDYGSKPEIRDYDPKPPRRDDYYTRPVLKEDRPSKPVSNPYGQPPRRDYDKGTPSYPHDKDVPGDFEDVRNEDDYNDYRPADEIKDPGTDSRPAPVKDDGNCICVPYYQCKDGHIVTDGSGIIDARRRPQPDEELPLDGKFKPPSCGPFHVCCNTPETSTVKPYEHRCGMRNPSGINSRILSPSNRGEADFGEWPWQAAVLKSEGTVNIFQCGGVLIDKYHVLTVAHCVFHLYKYNEYPLKVRLGEWDTQTTTEFLAHEDYKVSKITIHPEYRNTSLWNDIAILRLQEPVLFAPHIDTVCLPKYDEIFAGQNCVVTGWGKDSYKGGTFSNVMKEVALQVIDNYNCEEMLRKTRLGRFFQLHEGFVCAGGEHGLDSCKGDGGGPLVCYRKDRSYALAGLVSWGIDCGQPGVPGVYVKVQKYLDWISKNTGVSLEEYWPKV